MENGKTLRERVVLVIHAVDTCINAKRTDDRNMQINLTLQLDESLNML